MSKRSKRCRIPRPKKAAASENPYAKSTQKYIEECRAWEIEGTKFFEDAHAKTKARDQEAEEFLFSAKQSFEDTATVAPRKSITVSMDKRVADFLDFSLEDLEERKFTYRELQNFAKKHSIRANQKTANLLTELKKVFQDTLLEWQSNSNPDDLDDEAEADEELVATQKTPAPILTKQQKSPSPEPVEHPSTPSPPAHEPTSPPKESPPSPPKEISFSPPAVEQPKTPSPEVEQPKPPSPEQNLKPPSPPVNKHPSPKSPAPTQTKMQEPSQKSVVKEFSANRRGSQIAAPNQLPPGVIAAASIALTTAPSGIGTASTSTDIAKTVLAETAKSTSVPSDAHKRPANLCTGPSRLKPKKRERENVQKTRSEEDIIAEKDKVRKKRAKRQEEQREQRRLRNEAKRKRVQERKEQIELENRRKKEAKDAKEREKKEAKRLREAKKAEAVAKAAALALAKKKEQAAAQRRKEEQKKRLIAKRLAAKEAAREQARLKKLEQQRLEEQERIAEEKRVALLQKMKAINENANSQNKQKTPSSSAKRKPSASKHKKQDFNYELSPSGSESEESSDEDDVPRKKRKKVPAWASSEHLRMALKKQSSMRGADPDTIFPSIPDTCDLLAIFPYSRNVKTKARMGRQSSGDWNNDRVTAQEIREWRVHHNLPNSS